MKKKIRTLCPKCKETKNFYLFYKCNCCSNTFPHTENLKISKKITLLILLLIMISGCDIKKETNTFIPPEISWKLKVVEETDRNTPIEADYQFEYHNGNNFYEAKKGHLTADWNIISGLKWNQTFYRIYFWNDDYYVNSDSYTRGLTFTNRTDLLEFDKNSRKGNISIYHKGKLSIGKNNITLIVNVSNGQIKRPAICEKHSIGIIKIKPKSMILYCDKGNWLNYSLYHPENKSYVFYSEGIYRCGNFAKEEFEDKIAKCIDTDSNECFAETMKIPNRLINKVDSCYDTMKTYVNEPLIENIEIETMSYADENDYVEFLIVDSDFSPENRWSSGEWFFSFGNNEDIGMEDLKYKIFVEKFK